MRIDWSQEDTYGQASSPESGDLVQVGWSVIHYKMVYRLNLGPRQDVPRHILAMGLDPGKVAHIRAGAQFLGNSSFARIDQFGEPVRPPAPAFQLLPELEHLREMDSLEREA